MRDLSEIRSLLDSLEHQPAEALEGQDLDFKEWNTRSERGAFALVVEMAVCMAKAGGGIVVFGVSDKTLGRSNAIRGVPPEIDINRLKKTVYDSTDPCQDHPPIGKRCPRNLEPYGARSGLSGTRRHGPRYLLALEI